MKETLRVDCSECGELSTMVITAAPEVITRVSQELLRGYMSHSPQTCGGALTVSLKSHKPRAKKVQP